MRFKTDVEHGWNWSSYGLISVFRGLGDKSTDEKRQDYQKFKVNCADLEHRSRLLYFAIK